MTSGTRSRYLVGPGYDWAFFLMPPLVSLALGMAVSHSRFTEESFVLAGNEGTLAGLMLGVIIHAHLVAVFVRSHGNGQIRRRHPLRFVAVPILLWLGLVASDWLAVSATVLATFWDVWHSGAQTFGFARIYDRNQGNPAEQGRRLDFWLNQLLYAGPILAGATLVDHLASLDGFGDVGSSLFTQVPAYVESRQRYLTWAVLLLGTLFLVYYVWANIRMHRRGYRVAPLKVFLLATTGACSIYTWGFNTWGEAFLIMNLFHAVQYLALVWAAEHGQLMQRLRHLGIRSKRAGCLLFLALVLAYGAVAELVPAHGALWAVTIVVSLMHFWYDGFVWSVRAKQV
jgi:hypothetical protein